MDSDEDDFDYSDEDIEEFEQEVKARRSTPSLKLVSSSFARPEYSVLDFADLEKMQDAVIEDVAEVLKLSADEAAVLLLHYMWNKEKLLDNYWSDPTGTKISAGCLFDLNYNRHFTSPNADQLITCPVMFEDYPLNKTFTMGCKSEDFPDPEDHRFSKIAWKEYLKAKALDGSDCLHSTCQREGCFCVVPPSVWKNILSSSNSRSLKENVPKDVNGGLTTKRRLTSTEGSEETVYDRYRRFLIQSFVDINRDVKWCPTPGCEAAVQSSGGITEVLCSHCRNKFCFRCGKEAHAPVSCTLLEIWEDKCRNESETANWILSNTKSCPKCNVRIEKNSGCNHMTCSKCQFHFCWVCMGDWNDHGNVTGGFYNCNKYDAAQQSTSEANATKRAKQELDRYLHYYRRFSAQNQSLGYAKKQLAEAEEKMAEIQAGKGSGWVEVQFLGEAVAQLIESRRALKYSYVLAYYLPDCAAKTLFEHNQSDLESFTERLSELTEMKWELIERAAVNNQRVVTAKFTSRIIEAVEKEGMNEMALEALSRQAKGLK